MRIRLLAPVAGVVFALSAPSGAADRISIDGSSTVFVLSEAAAEEFQKVDASTPVTVGTSGTGGGFKKFCAGEIDINDASRPILEAEQELCKKNKVEFVELPIAYDGVTVVVHPKNTFVDSLTEAELAKIWAPGSGVKKWSDIRAGWPERAIKLFGPGHDSGTFDFFTEWVTGKAKASRADYTASENDNVLVKGVSAEVDSLGYFGYAYFEKNASLVRGIPIVSAAAGAKAVMPSVDAIASGVYPGSRPLFIYVNAKSLGREAVKKFVSHYLTTMETVAREVGYVPMPKEVYELAHKSLEQGRIGTRFGGASKQHAGPEGKVTRSVLDILKAG